MSKSSVLKILVIGILKSMIRSKIFGINYYFVNANISTKLSGKLLKMKSKTKTSSCKTQLRLPVLFHNNYIKPTYY